MFPFSKKCVREKSNSNQFERLINIFRNMKAKGIFIYLYM